MALLSVKRFLTQLEEEAAYRRAISILLEGVATHALNLDRDACRNFGERIGEIRRALASETTVEALLADAGAAVEAIGDYARETNRLIETQGAEMRNMIAMFTGTPTGAGDGLQAAAPVQDAFTLKPHPREEPVEIREDAKRENAEPGPMVQTVHREVSRPPESSRGLIVDPVTELPCEAAAQAQFLAAIRNGEQKHVAVFVLGSAQRINLRFGRAAGDEVIRALKQYLAGRLESGDRMYRWPGPAIVALLSTTEPFDRVRARMKRFLEKPIERTLDINGRSVLIPLSVAWSVFALSLPLAVPNRQIHDFIAGQGYRDEDPIPA